MLVLTDEKGRPLGEVRCVGLFTKGGMVLRTQGPLRIDMNGEVHHTEIRTVSGTDAPGELVHTIDLPAAVRVHHGQEFEANSLHLHFKNEWEVAYV